ncbi:hypothetical protein RRF57_008777 [Xylaria bambusicola]|uniref:C2H2-type domain-containing protein n=1 Tax=Xylaria bambusicola TaxID=326684 RepID=A0AAN7UTY2_9PEZI
MDRPSQKRISRRVSSLRKQRNRLRIIKQQREAEAKKKRQEDDKKKLEEEGKKLEDEKKKQEADVRMSLKFLEKFNKENHFGRIPPDPSVLPAEFRCIHCKKIVKREENINPWHSGVLHHPSKTIYKPNRFNEGEYIIVDDGGYSDSSSRMLRWTCCDRAENEAPGAEDWHNMSFSRGDPSAQKNQLNPHPLTCPPTYHEHEEGAAGWKGWFTIKDGVLQGPTRGW